MFVNLLRQSFIMTKMNILAWIIFGLIAGWIAHTLRPEPARGGVLGTLILGILGALLGGFLGSLIFGVGITGFNITSFIVAVLGALVVLFADRYLSRRV